MSTCNYYSRKDTPLVVYDSDDQVELDWQAEEADAAAREFSDSLRWYRVEVRGGYYTGIQFDLVLTDAGEFADGLDGDDDTARDWYDMTAAEVAQDMKKEHARAVAWIREWIKDGWTELGVAGVFSNGEAVYFQIAPRRVYVTGPESVAEPVKIAFYNNARA